MKNTTIARLLFPSSSCLSILFSYVPFITAEPATSPCTPWIRGIQECLQRRVQSNLEHVKVNCDYETRIKKKQYCNALCIVVRARLTCATVLQVLVYPWLRISTVHHKAWNIHDYVAFDLSFTRYSHIPMTAHMIRVSYIPFSDQARLSPLAICPIKPPGYHLGTLYRTRIEQT